MPSISIYGPAPVIGLDSKYHYVYRITNLIENKHYYGSRTSKINPFDDLGIKYFSSAYTHFWMRKDQRNNPQNYKYKILKTFTNRHDAIIFECIIHKKVDAANSEKFYNAINQFDNKRYVSGTVLCKDKYDNYYMVQDSDPRYLSGELVPFWTGKAIVKDSNGRRFSVDVDDPRYLSGELISVNTNRVIVKDKDGCNYFVDKTDPRYLSGELISVATGKVAVKDTNGNRLLVDKTDPRYLSGELISVSVGTVSVKDETGAYFRVSKTDPRYLSGELVSHMKDKISVRDKNNNMLRVDKNDPRYLSGELIKSGNTSNFKYWKVTPWGIFDTSSVFEPEIKTDVLRYWCKTAETTRMVKRTYKRYKKLQETFGVECIGKTFRELGFYNLTDEEYKQTLKSL